MAHLCLGTWRISVWEDGAFLLGKLALFRSVIWRKTIWEDGENCPTFLINV